MFVTYYLTFIIFSTISLTKLGVNYKFLTISETSLHLRSFEFDAKFANELT